jgi:hypothetical protein
MFLDVYGLIPNILKLFYEQWYQIDYRETLIQWRFKFFF